MPHAHRVRDLYHDRRVLGALDRFATNDDLRIVSLIELADCAGLNESETHQAAQRLLASGDLIGEWDTDDVSRVALRWRPERREEAA